MKKAFLLFLQTLLLSAAFGQGIQFEADGTAFAEARAKSAEQGKMLFVTAYSSTCHVCEQVLTKTFPQEAVGSFFNKNFVNFKVDVESTEGIEFGNEFAIIAFPTFLFFDETGQLLHRSQGSVDAGKMLEIGSDALSPDGQYFTLLRRYEAGDHATPLLKKLTLLAKDLENVALLQSVHYEYLLTQPNWLEKENMDFLVKALRFIEQPTLPFLLEHFAEFEREIGIGEVNTVLDKAVLNSLSANAYDRQMRKFDMEQARRYGSLYLPADLLERSLSIFAFNQCLIYDDIPCFLAAAEQHFDTYPSHNAQMLNNIAVRFYENTNDPALLAKAASWAVRAAELKDNHRHNDLAAALHAKLGQLDKAASFAEKAIRLGTEAGLDVGETTALLVKIKGEQAAATSN